MCELCRTLTGTISTLISSERFCCWIPVFQFIHDLLQLLLSWHKSLNKQKYEKTICESVKWKNAILIDPFMRGHLSQRFYIECAMLAYDVMNDGANICLSNTFLIWNVNRPRAVANNGKIIQWSMVMLVSVSVCVNFLI